MQSYYQHVRKNNVLVLAGYVPRKNSRIPAINGHFCLKLANLSEVGFAHGIVIIGLDSLKSNSFWRMFFRWLKKYFKNIC